MEMGVQLSTRSGERIGGHLVGSGAQKVIVIHEIFGLTSHMREIADRLAGDGFTVFAIDLFDGKTAVELEDGFALAGALDWQDAVCRIDRAAQALRSAPGDKVAVVGFCLGGAIALAASAQVASLQPCVCFYGIPGPERADLTRIRGQVIAHFGTRDSYISNERVDALQQLLAGGGVRAQIHRYDEDHGFVRERPEHDAAQLAWRRTVAFLRTEL